MHVNKRFAIFISCYILIIATPLMPTELANNNRNNNSGSDDEQEETNLKAVTENGESVILYSDGTWEYSSEPEVEEKVDRKINSSLFKTPLSSKEALKGNIVNYKIWYNKNKWGILDNNINDMAEYSLLHHDKNAYLLVIPEKLSIPLENLRNIVVGNARKASKKIKILSEEERNVNGLKVIMLNVRAEIQGMSFMYLYYIYSGEKSSMQIIGFTTEEMFPEYRHDIEDFINGFEMDKSGEAQQPVEVQEINPVSEPAAKEEKKDESEKSPDQESGNH